MGLLGSELVVWLAHALELEPEPEPDAELELLLTEHGAGSEDGKAAAGELVGVAAAGDGTADALDEPEEKGEPEKGDEWAE